MTVPGAYIPLFVKPELKTYKSSEASVLMEDLQRLAEETSTGHLQSPRELLLTAAGKTTEDDYAYLYPAFSAVTRKLCRGAAKLLPDLAGCVALGEAPVRGVDAGFAISVFNRLVDLRFDRLHRARLVRNHRAKTIDSVLGPQYQHYDSSMLFRTAQDVVLGESEARFHGARLLGRDLTAWFILPGVITQILHARQIQKFRLGYVLFGGEGNDLAVRFTWAIFGPSGTAVASLREGFRLRHTGTGFQDRLAAGLTGAVRRPLPADQVRQRLVGCATQGVGVTLESPEAQLAQRKRTLQQRLRSVGCPAPLAVTVLQGIVHTALTSQGLPPAFGHERRIYAQLTSLDVFNQILIMALQLPIRQRDQLERAAFRYLMERGSSSTENATQDPR